MTKSTSVLLAVGALLALTYSVTAAVSAPGVVGLDFHKKRVRAEEVHPLPRRQSKTVQSAISNELLLYFINVCPDDDTVAVHANKNNRLRPARQANHSPFSWTLEAATSGFPTVKPRSVQALAEMNASTVPTMRKYRQHSRTWDRPFKSHMSMEHKLEESTSPTSSTLAPQSSPT